MRRDDDVMGRAGRPEDARCKSRQPNWSDLPPKDPNLWRRQWWWWWLWNNKLAIPRHFHVMSPGLYEVLARRLQEDQGQWSRSDEYLPGSKMNLLQHQQKTVN